MASSTFTPTQLGRLWRLYAGMDLLYIARGPGVAFTYYLAELVIGAAAATATFLLAARFDGIGAWSRPQILFLLGYAMLVRMLVTVFFSYNLAHISRRIGRGQLDHLLIQPQPLWAALVTEGFAPVSGSSMLAPAAFLLIWSGQQLDMTPSAAWWALFVVDVLASVVIVQSFEYAWGSVAFWAPRAAEEINSHSWDMLQTLIPFPLDGLSGLALTSLLTIVPAGLIAWYPTRVLLGVAPVSWVEAAALPAAAVLFATFAAWTFTRGLRHYGRTGSSRYLEYGHRR
ncbi:MAG: ABC-2 family transporter protein [Chloroflexi bacterium]|nr:ABC-2 family transporter protein [Chloroflexota bacterium]